MAERQTPNKFQISISKIQNRKFYLGHWNLDIGIYLGFGIYDFGFFRFGA